MTRSNSDRLDKLEIDQAEVREKLEEHGTLLAEIVASLATLSKAILQPSSEESSVAGESNKRKYEDHQTSTSPAPRRVTGFSSGPEVSGPPASYNGVPPPLSEIELAKRKAQEIAARLLNNVEPMKRARVENDAGGGGFDSSDAGFVQKPTGMGLSGPPKKGASYGYSGPTKQIGVPNGRVGVIIGKGGEEKGSKRLWKIERFPDPKSLVDHLHHTGFKAIWMLDPGIKIEEGYFIFASGSEEAVWIQTADGKPYTGEVWHGPCVFPDYTQSKTRSWWAGLVKDFIPNGVDGIWNDMNEPAVFQTVTKTMPENNIHMGDAELGGCQNHSYYHNVYGTLMAKSTYEGMKLADDKKRPFVLTRAGFVGSQKYAATWTGDNISSCEHLHMSISMVVQLGLSGQPLSGPDIGGYAGNATPKLFARWMGFGSWFPFCRGHSESDTTNHEPWSFGEECEEVCRLALRTQENAFMLGPPLVYSSTEQNQELYQMQHNLPKGSWFSFDFEDSHPDLPAFYLQGGLIIPVAPVSQHTGEANPTNDLTLVVSLDEHGRAQGILFEDEGDGYEYTNGGYLLTTYVAEQHSFVVTVTVARTEGSRKRPNRRLHVQLLLGKGAMIDAWGTDGKVLQIPMPSETELSDLVSTSENRFKFRIENAIRVPVFDNASHGKGTEISRAIVEMKSGEWFLKVVPWIGGRIISMQHLPSGIQWLHSRVEINGYEEYTGLEYRSAGCSEEYSIIEQGFEQAGESEKLKLEGDIGGGLILERQIYFIKDKPKIFGINSSIVARNVGAGSGGFSRLTCLRVHPMFNLPHPTKSYVSFTAIDGSNHEIWPDTDEQFFEGDFRPNGEWMLVDNCLGMALRNRFDINQVQKCLVHWGTGTVNLELWSEHRPISKETPLTISHEYDVHGMV